MVNKPKETETTKEDKQEVLQEVKEAVKNLENSKLSDIRKELEDLGKTRNERIKSFNVDDKLINVIFEDSSGKEVRHITRKL